MVTGDPRLNVGKAGQLLVPTNEQYDVEGTIGNSEAYGNVVDAIVERPLPEQDTGIIGEDLHSIVGYLRTVGKAVLKLFENEAFGG